MLADPFEMANFTTTKMGNPQLVDSAGYEYTKHSSDASGFKIYWRCSKYKSKKCPARATTEGNYVFKSGHLKSLGQQCLHNH